MRTKLLEERNYGPPAVKCGPRSRGSKWNQAPKSRLKLLSNGRSSQVHRRNVNVQTLRRAIHLHFTPLRYSAYLMSAFSTLALVLACLGVYAVISYLVAERTHDIGIRVALGASSAQVSSAVLGESVRLVAAGLVIGLLGAVALARLLSHLLFGVSAMDIPPYLASAAVFLLVGLAAAWFPARRAMRVDPLVALRQL